MYLCIWRLFLFIAAHIVQTGHYIQIQFLTEKSVGFALRIFDSSIIFTIMERLNAVKKRKIDLSGIVSFFEAPETRKNNAGVDKRFYKCKECKKEINGTKSSNLTEHLKHHHELHSQIYENDCIEKKRTKLLLDCVEFVAVDGNPFSKINGSGLLSMLEKTLNELKQAGRSVNLTKPHLYEVKEMLRQTAENVKQKIREELKARLFCLMVDITTKRRRSILGVSVQFIVNGKHVIRSLGMLELDESHTGEYLATVILGLISEYGATAHQVIAITTDNGSNVVKMVHDVTTLMTLIETNRRTESNRESEDIVASDADVEIQNYLTDMADCTDEQALAMIFQANCDSDEEVDDDAIAQNIELLKAISSNLQNTNVQNGARPVKSMRCIVHTMQLGVHVGISGLSQANKNVIGLCRLIAKTMRLKSTEHELKNAGIAFTFPHLDVATRWCSTYVMVNKFRIDFCFE